MDGYCDNERDIIESRVCVYEMLSILVQPLAMPCLSLSWQVTFALLFLPLLCLAPLLLHRRCLRLALPISTCSFLVQIFAPVMINDEIGQTNLFQTLYRKTHIYSISTNQPNNGNRPFLPHTVRSIGSLSIVLRVKLKRERE